MVTVTSFTTTQVAGSEQPVVMGASVQVQQQNADATWTTIATGSVDASGGFAVPVTLSPGGTNRVTVTAGAGYAPGTSAPQIVMR
jgi:hypothetical protein